MASVFVRLTTLKGRILAIGLLFACIWLSACASSAPTLYATLTLKSDGSHFYGTVVRRETNSITITGASGDTHTFLYTELSDIKYGAPTGSGTSSGQAATSSVQNSGQSSGVEVNGETVVLPTGTEVAVRTRGFLDSCCGPLGGLSLGTTDFDTKVGTKVVIPGGASVTLERIDNKPVDGQISLTFELRSADFQNHHYVFESAEGGSAAGLLITFKGAKSGTAEAKERGTNVHLESEAFMGFKATVPVTLKRSE
jgi:hypothetical protein